MMRTEYICLVTNLVQVKTIVVGPRCCICFSILGMSIATIVESKNTIVTRIIYPIITP
jgi:hypothetical protein